MRGYRPTPGFVTSIIALLFVAYVATHVITFSIIGAADIAPKAPKISKPQECQKFRRAYTADEWNEETQSFPLNHKWFDCMGVGIK